VKTQPKNISSLSNNLARSNRENAARSNQSRRIRKELRERGHFGGLRRAAGIEANKNAI